MLHSLDNGKYIHRFYGVGLSFKDSHVSFEVFVSFTDTMVENPGGRMLLFNAVFSDST